MRLAGRLGLSFSVRCITRPPPASTADPRSRAGGPGGPSGDGRSSGADLAGAVRSGRSGRPCRAGLPSCDGLPSSGGLLVAVGLLFATGASLPERAAAQGVGIAGTEKAEAAPVVLEARRGDGIWSLLRRGGITPSSAAIREFKSLNRGRLIRGGQLVRGRSYTLPGAARHGGSTGSGGSAAAGGSMFELYPIFGPERERVERKTRRLEGHVYYIVSGHGGPDPGTIGRYGGRSLPEDEVAYDVSLRLARRLIEQGATVHVIVQDPDDGIRDVTRFPIDRDERYLGNRTIVLDQRRRLRDRAAIINRLYDEHRRTAKLQRLLALHVDARGLRHEPQIDVHFQVFSDGGRRFANVLLATFRDQYDRVQPGRGYEGSVERRNLYVLRETKPVAALVELGNIRHPLDQRRLVRPNNREALARWLVEGLLREADALRRPDRSSVAAGGSAGGG